MRPICESTTQPVDGRFAHRVSVSETFVGPASHVGGDRYSLRAVWPRTHQTYRTKAAPPDSLLLCETFRQAAYVVCHMHRGIPLGRKFLLSKMSLDEVSPLGRHAGPAAATVTVDVVELGRTKAEAGPVRVRGEITVPGSFRATLAASGAILSERVYGRVRGRGVIIEGSAEVPLSHTRHAPSSNALLPSETQGPNTWTLVVDPAHPSHFDHPLDHVPGSLLLAAARGAMRATLGDPDAEPRAIDASFGRFVELAEQTDVHLSTAPEGMTVDFVQGGFRCARIVLTPPKGTA